MKKTMISAAFCCLCATALAQTCDDPVLMTINGNPITRSEFEYSYNKNNADGVIDKKSVKDYVPLYTDFKLKVEAAKDLGIDSLSAIKTELQGYKEQMVMGELVDQDFIEREARKTYDATAERFAGSDMLTASHILVLQKQDADAATAAACKAKADSIYRVLQGGADFAEVAKACSDDRGSAARGGYLGTFNKGMMVPEFEKAAYELQAGQMSQPVKSQFGWHIIKMEDRHPFESYEYHHDNIIKFLEQRGVKEASANALIDSVSKAEHLSRAEVIDRYHKQITDGNADQRYLAQEYYDGTLMYEASKTQVWDKAARDEAGLQNYFLQHKKDYAWDQPRYRGIVIHAKDKATLAKAKKLTKGADQSQWPSTIVKNLNTDSVRMVRVEHGLFKPGDNKTVDALGFKSSKDFKPDSKLPYTAVVGKKLKAPQTYADVKGQVTADYQQQLEKEWVESLRKKYTVVVDEQVLETVNNH